MESQGNQSILIRVGVSSEMSEFEVRTSSESYTVQVTSGAGLPTDASVMVIDDYFQASEFSSDIPVAYFHASEESKTLQGCEELLARLRELGLRRSDSIGAVGGGVIQDVTTLAASLYMRGVDWQFYPTTAMSMLDSCIGGKSSINVSGIKNLVGNIYPPKRVVVDVDFARTLDLEALTAGFAEAIKICFAGQQTQFDDFLEFQLWPEEYGTEKHVEQSINLTTHVLNTKRWFIEIDEFDKKERQLLNFGHTFGHALEAATDFRLQHGIAIAAGLVAATDNPWVVTSGKSQALAEYCLGMWNALPQEIGDCLDEIDWSKFRSALESDKKGTKESLRFVLPDDAGILTMLEVPRNRRSLDVASESMARAIERLKSGTVPR